MLKKIKTLLPRRFRTNHIEIPVVRLHGIITADRAGFRSGLSFNNCSPLLKKAFSEKDAPAVALIINSPGGAPVQAHLIYKYIRSLAQENKKEVLVFVEDIAASGGYMLACAGDKIFADASSIIGSIGVVSASFGFPELLKKIGVERRLYTAGEKKAVLDPFSPERPEDVGHLKTLQNEIHQYFIDLVQTSRKQKLSANPEIFSGLFWTGVKAKELGLIDELGDLYTTLKHLYGNETKLKFITAPKSFLRGKLMGGLTASTPNPLLEGVHALQKSYEEMSFWTRYGL